MILLFLCVWACDMYINVCMFVHTCVCVYVCLYVFILEIVRVLLAGLTNISKKGIVNQATISAEITIALSEYFSFTPHQILRGLVTMGCGSSRRRRDQQVMSS